MPNKAIKDTITKIMATQIDKFWITVLNLVLPCKKPGRTNIKTPIKYTIDINLFVKNSKILKIILVKNN